MDFVLSILGLSFVHDVGDQVVGGALRILDLDVRPEKISELDSADGKVDDGRVLLNVESVLSEPHDVENDVGRQLGDLELLEKIFFVRVVLALGLAVELGQKIVLKSRR